MPTFAVSYTEPGVYVRIQNVNIPALPPGVQRIALVGYGKLTKNVINEEITRGGDTKDALSYSNENAVSISSQISDEFGNRYYETTDYVLNTGVGGEEAEMAEVDWSPAGSEPTAGVKYYVNYVVNKLSLEGDFDPKIMYSAEESVDTYGTPQELNGNSKEQSLPTGAQLVFTNGASQVVCVQINPDDSDPINDAIDKLESEEVTVVIPCVPVSSTVNTGVPAYLSTHVDLMSEVLEGKFRIVILGVPAGTDATGFSTALSEYTALGAIANRRIGVIGTSRAQITINSELKEVGSWAMACAIGGIIGIESNNAGEPISGKILAGFTAIYDTFKRNQKNQIAQQGVTVIEKDGAVYRVRHFLSTDMATVLTQEMKATIISDYIASITINALKAVFINTRNLGEETTSNIKAVQRLLLEAQVPDIINGYDKIDATVNELDPRQIDLNFAILPTLDVNWIYVTLGVEF